MLISKAYAAVSETSGALTDLANAPSPMEAFMWNMGLVVVLVGLFYVLLIMPQQRRFKEHSGMLSGLKKGDRVVTGGGLVGKIDKVTEGDDEVLIDLGNAVKVTALRATIQTKTESKPANDAKAKAAPKKKVAEKKVAEKASDKKAPKKDVKKSS